MDNREGLSRGTLIIGMLLVALGIVFLVASLLGRNVIGLWWPLFVIAVGLLFFVPLLLHESAWGAFAIPGSLITVTGLVLLFQNLFNAWETWAYAWALVAPFAVGLGLYIFGAHAGQRQLKDAGGVVMRVGLILFLVFGFLFEGILGVSGRLWLRLVWPVLLILFGLWIILRPTLSRTARQPVAGSGPYQTVEGTYQEPSPGPSQGTSPYAAPASPVWPSPAAPAQPAPPPTPTPEPTPPPAPTESQPLSGEPEPQVPAGPPAQEAEAPAAGSIADTPDGERRPEG